jgi:FAD:protein FMN transferase
MSLDRRLRPLLGTLVEISASGPVLMGSVDAAFDRIAAIHDALSFQSSTSELTKLNQRATRGAVAVSPMLREVLLVALDIARASAGAFDPTVGGVLVGAGLLPAPSADRVHPEANYLDVHVQGNEVHFAKPLWLDFGGIAKGYAVDQAVHVLQRRGTYSGVVNAGGDLRVFGPQPHRVVLRGAGGELSHQVLELREQAIASSGGALSWRENNHGDLCATLLHRGRLLGNQKRCVSVVAEQAILADALTKVALFSDQAEVILRRYGAYMIVQAGDANLSMATHKKRVA